MKEVESLFLLSVLQLFLLNATYKMSSPNAFGVDSDSVVDDNNTSSKRTESNGGNRVSFSDANDDDIWTWLETKSNFHFGEKVTRFFTTSTRFRISLLSLFIFYVIGLIYYAAVEKWNFIEIIYFITVSLTVSISYLV